MIKVMQSPDEVVAIRVSRKVDKQEWETVTSAVKDALTRHDQLGLYVDFADLDAMTAGAVLKDIEFSLKNIGDFDQFTRMAVVNDAGGIGKLTHLGGKLLPGLETRAFEPGEEKTALQWAAGHSSDAD